MTGKKPTGRTKQLSLKTTPKFHQRLKEIAVKEKCLMIEILEKAMELYEREKKDKKKIAKENATVKVSQPAIKETPATKKRSRDDDVIESPDPISKKRKISDY
jgi:hypothetical protein